MPTLSFVITAEDKASAVMGKVDGTVKAMTGSVGKLEGGFSRISGVLRYSTQHLNAFAQGMGFGVGIGSFYALERIIGRVAGLLPDLVQKGASWASTIDDISDRTGLSAAHASELAAVQQMVGGQTDTLTRGLSLLGRTVAGNASAFEKLGIRVKDNNGVLLSSWQIFQNIREKVSQAGSSFLSTHAAMSAFGKSAASLLDLLKLSNPQWAIYAAQARAAGLILSDAAVQAGEDWARTQNVLGTTITGLASQVFQGAAPALIALVNGISTFIQQNMQGIVNFAVQAINFIAGLISGFLGINLNLQTVAASVNALDNATNKTKNGLIDFGNKQDDVAKSTQGATNAIQKQIDAIDAQLDRLDKAEQRYDYRKRLEEARKAVSDAEKELDDVRSSLILSSEMSALERVQAILAHKNDMAAAQQRLQQQIDTLEKLRHDRRIQLERDALNAQKDALQKQLAMMQQQLAAAKQQTAALDALSKQWARFQHPDTSTDQNVFTQLTEDMKEAAEQARRSGQQIATSFREFLFGKDIQVEPFEGMNQGSFTFHSPGLIEKMGGLIAKIGEFATSIGNTFGWFERTFPGLIGQLIAALIILKAALWIGSPILTALGTLAKLWPGGTPPTPPAGTPGGTVPVPGAIGFILPKPIYQMGQDAYARMMQNKEEGKRDTVADFFLNLLGGGNKPPTPEQQAADRAAYEKLVWENMMTQRMFGGPARGTYYEGRPTYPQPGLPEEYSLPYGYGKTPNDQTNMEYFDMEERLLRRYLGAGSPLEQGIFDQTNQIGKVSTNTAGLPDGVNANIPPGTEFNVGNWISTLGVTNSAWGGKFADIGKILGWPAANLTVQGKVGANIVNDRVPVKGSVEIGNTISNKVPIKGDVGIGSVNENLPVKVQNDKVPIKGNVNASVGNTVSVVGTGTHSTSRALPVFQTNAGGGGSDPPPGVARRAPRNDEIVERMDVLIRINRAVLEATRHQTTVLHRDLSRPRRSPATTSTRPSTGTGL